MSCDAVWHMHEVLGLLLALLATAGAAGTSPSAADCTAWDMAAEEEAATARARRKQDRLLWHEVRLLNASFALLQVR